MTDGYTVRGRYWPATHPRAAIIYLHGIQSHGGWYEHSASVLASEGCAVLLPDRRGSGLNADCRGDVPDRRQLLVDNETLSGWLCEATGIERLAIVGVSWGGKLAAASVNGCRNRFAAALLIAPGIYPAVDVGWQVRMRIGVSLLTGRGRRPFELPLQDPALFTDNPAGRAFIAADRLKLTHATARFLFVSRLLDGKVRRARPARGIAATLVLADRDKIIRNGPTETWFRAWAGPSAEVRQVPASAHTLELDADNSAFMAILRRWAGQLAEMPTVRNSLLSGR